LGLKQGFGQKMREGGSVPEKQPFKKERSAGTALGGSGCLHSYKLEGGYIRKPKKKNPSNKRNEKRRGNVKLKGPSQVGPLSEGGVLPCPCRGERISQVRNEKNLQRKTKELRPKTIKFFKHEECNRKRTHGWPKKGHYNGTQHQR